MGTKERPNVLNAQTSYGFAAVLTQELQSRNQEGDAASRITVQTADEVVDACKGEQRK